MGANPLGQQQNLRGLKNWMEEKHLNTLYSISEWEQNTWIKWRVSVLPPRLKSQWEDLKILLVGAAPINKEDQDGFVWDLSEENYTSKSGYNYLQNYNNHNDWNLWKATWKNESLPKIKFFTWSLLKGKILIAENFKKKASKGLPNV